MTDHLTRSRSVYEHREEVQLVDVREAYEWQAGRIEGSVLIPLNELMSGGGAELDRTRPVVAICRSGNRSELASLMLQARGYEAYNLEGGVEDWVREGLPFTTPQGQRGIVV